MYFKQKTALLLLLAIYGKLTEGYRRGAPASTCIDMMPHHSGNNPMQNRPPFEIIVRKNSMTYTPGERIQVTIRPHKGAQTETFVGFLIKAGSRNSHFVGSFATLPDSRSQYLNCQAYGAGDKQIITHSMAFSSGQGIGFIWEAPQSNVGDVIIRATLVKSFNTFWTGVDSPPLQYRAPQPQPQPKVPQQFQPTHQSHIPAQNQQALPRQPPQFQPQNPQQMLPQQPPQHQPRNPQQLQPQHPPQFPPQNPQQFQPQQPPQLRPGNPQQLQHQQPPQFQPQGLKPLLPPNLVPKMAQPQQPPQLHPQQPFLPQNVPQFQPQELPPFQPQQLPPFQPNQPQSPFQRPPNQGEQPQHQPIPTLPMLRTLPAFTPVPTMSPKTTTKAPPAILQKYAECDVTQGCHAECAGILCKHVVSWKDIGDFVEFELAAKLETTGDQWISIGLSDDLKMGNDEVMECVSENGIVDVFHSFNIGKSNKPSTSEKLGLSNTEGSFVNGIFKCKFRRTKQIIPSDNQEDTMFNLTKDWHLMFGYGPAYPGFQTGMHGKLPMVTPNKIDFQSIVQGTSASGEEKLAAVNVSSTTSTSTTTQIPLEPGKLIKDEACGVTKGCYRDCSGSKCRYTVSWQDTKHYTDFEVSTMMQNIGNQWTAIAFSEDKKMGNDEVIECVSSDEKVEVFRSFNDGKINRRSSNPKEGLKNTRGSFKDGIFTCSFRRFKNLVRSKRSAEDTMMVDLDREWHLMFGSGPASTDYNKRPHTKTPLVSPKKVNFQSYELIGGSAGYPLIKAHACLMIIAWILFTGVGIVAARYFKTVWVTSSFMGQKIWFQIHRTCMVTVLVLTLIGFVIIFIEAGGYSQIAKVPGKEFTQAHPVLGIIVTLLCIGNPIMSLFRPGPKDKNRPLFNWAHWAVGVLAHVLSVITICFGIELNKSSTPDYAVWVVVGYVVYHLLMEVSLKTFDVCVDRPQSAGNRNSYEMKNKAQYGTTENGNGSQPPTYAEVNKVPKNDLKDSSLKKIFLLIHVIFAVAFTLTLVLLVVMY